MAVVSGILFGAAVAIYIVSLYDKRVKKPYAWAAAVVAAVASLAEFTTSFTPVSQTCMTVTNTSIAGMATSTQTCIMNYANDSLAFIFFVLSLLLILFQTFEFIMEELITPWP